MAEISGSILTDSSASESDEGKIWLGNLDNTVTEYQLLQILKQYGDIKTFEFLFHMHGPLKGKPRGYCFVKFASKFESERALKELNGKQLQSKRVIVNWAKKRQIHDESGMPLKQDESHEKMEETDSKERKIKAIEAKLRLMEQGIETTFKNPLKEKHSSTKDVVKKKSLPYGKNTKKRFKR